MAFSYFSDRIELYQATWPAKPKTFLSCSFYKKSLLNSPQKKTSTKVHTKTCSQMSMATIFTLAKKQTHNSETIPTNSIKTFKKIKLMEKWLR